MATAVLLIKLEHGGYVVKEHDVYNLLQRLLFAGTLEECLGFLQKWMENGDA
jgi:hypothetical protein